MRAKKLSLAVASTLLGSLLLLAAVVAARSDTAAPVSAAGMSIGRSHDPVVVPGSELPEFDGVPLDELVLLARDSDGWGPIPFQIDEVTASGEYTTTEDGLLDANDELVFMGYDAGQAVPSGDWVVDDEARLHPRYAVTVTDPLAPGDIAHAYLYRSSTLGRSPTHYLTFDEPAQTVTALSYTVVFSPNTFIGMSDLYINGHGTDVLDRQKLRVTTSGLLNLTLDEEELIDQVGVQTLTLPVSGPVRAVSPGGTTWFAFYAARIDADLNVPFTEVEIPGSTIDQARLSYDWNDPATTGMAPATHYDSNTPGGVAVDGVAEILSTTPPVSWDEIDGSLGAVVFVSYVDHGEDLLSNYYKDDSTVDGDDTGDQRSFGDSGLVVDKSGDTLGDAYIAQTAYILPPQSGNVGDLAEQWLHNPLLATTAVEHYLSIAVFLPLTVRG